MFFYSIVLQTCSVENTITGNDKFVRRQPKPGICLEVLTKTTKPQRGWQMSQIIRTRWLLCTTAVGFRYTNSHGRKVLCVCIFALCLIQHQALSKADWKCSCTQCKFGCIWVDMRGQRYDTPSVHPGNELHIPIGQGDRETPGPFPKTCRRNVLTWPGIKPWILGRSLFLCSFAEFQIYNPRILRMRRKFPQQAWKHRKSYSLFILT
jgi:hypothetical protein